MSDHTLILGLAAGYHYGDMRPFLASLGDSGFSGRCVLFVSDTTRDLDAGAGPRGPGRPRPTGGPPAEAAE
jgi:hypothetical protein